MRESRHADWPAWRCRAGSVDLIGSGRLDGYAADFARGCVFRLSLSQPGTRRGFRFRSLTVAATGLPRPRTRPIASLCRQTGFSGPYPLRTLHLSSFHVAAQWH